MKVLGITGGVGSGKSEVLDYLESRYGAYVCQMDEVAKRLEKRGEISEDESERAQAEVQKLTDEHINDLDGLWEKKEKEIMTI